VVLNGSPRKWFLTARQAQRLLKGSLSGAYDGARMRIARGLPLVAALLYVILLAGDQGGRAVSVRATASETGKIAFLRNGRPGCAIFVVEPDGRKEERLTGWHIGCGTPPTWSPDGTRLAFFARGSLWVMNSDGTHRRRLSPASYGESSGRGPSFAPDGQSLVFARNPSSSRHASAIFEPTALSGGSRRRSSHPNRSGPLAAT
jgi:WD40 repeat protein